MKIVINDQYGGFELSLLAIKMYLKSKRKEAYFYKTIINDNKITYEKTNEDDKSIFTFCFTKDFGTKITDKDITSEDWGKYSFSSKSIKRTDKYLVKVIEELGNKANTMCSTLKIIDIPNDVDWTIEEYDGNEWVAEKHRTWC